MTATDRWATDVCVLQDGECACSSYAREHDLKSVCYNANDIGRCIGWRECTDSGLSACDAPAATWETCNGEDDDCDGYADQGELCDDKEGCTKDWCGAEQGCLHSDKSGLPCADDDPCTENDECLEGVCVGVPMTCPGSDEPCSVAECWQGKCFLSPQNEGLLCEADGTVCTTDVCLVGKCTTVPADNGVACEDDGTPCTLDLCQDGGCAHPPVSDETPCDDGDGCTMADHCWMGSCTGGGYVESLSCLTLVSACGDGICQYPESATLCAVDCGPCGDDICGNHEIGPLGGSCPEDCLTPCGDGVCDGGEDPMGCLVDCGGCGDGFCGLNESSGGCPGDCPPACGNALCEPPEVPETCAVDCLPPCGDGLCEKGENPQLCAADCPICGDGVCGLPESESGKCPQDCSTACGDTVCQGGEDFLKCPLDCGYCGDKMCGIAENGDTCPTDCLGSLTAGFVALDKGAFWMGSPAGGGEPCPLWYMGGGCAGDGLGTTVGEKTRWGDEGLHYVKLSRDLEFQQSEVTQDEWQKLTNGWIPSQFKECGGSCPVENVSWFDACAFANLRSKSLGFMPCYLFSDIACVQGGNPGEDGDYEFCLNQAHGGIALATVALSGGLSKPSQCPGFRLPTEAEWEYAARAGSSTPWPPSPGNNGILTWTGWSPTDPNLDQIGWYGGNSKASYQGAYECSAWFPGCSAAGPQPAGGKEENAWGLTDMIGNVWEWCFDWYAAYPAGTKANACVDPCGAVGSQKVARGGGWSSFASLTRCANRNSFDPDVRDGRIGLRLCRSLNP